jgi:hypothetical protein
MSRRFGAPDPITLRDNSIGEQPFQKHDNSNRGALFKNTNKDGNAPDYRGTINVGGVDHWINGWITQSKKGEKYMSLSVRAKNNGSEQ